MVHGACLVLNGF